MGTTIALSLWPDAHTMPLGMTPSESDGLQSLRTELRLRRLNSRRTPHPIRHADVAELMGVHKTFVSRLESGKRSIRALSGELLYHFLTGYRYTPLEIEGIVSRYRLNSPPQLLESRAAESGMVTVMDEGGSVPADRSRSNRGADRVPHGEQTRARHSPLGATKRPWNATGEKRNEPRHDADDLH